MTLGRPDPAQSDDSARISFQILYDIESGGRCFPTVCCAQGCKDREYGRRVIDDAKL